MTIEELKKENMQLKNRCFVLTRGSLCFYCPVDCEHRKEKFRNDNPNGE